jgi:hypothetical protein
MKQTVQDVTQYKLYQTVQVVTDTCGEIIVTYGIRKKISKFTIREHNVSYSFTSLWPSAFHSTAY